MRKFPLFCLITAAPVASACGSRGSVALTAVAEDPAVTVERSALAGDVTGGFRLELSLGDYAEDATNVSIGTFSIQRDGQDVLAPLSLGGQSFPVPLDPGESKAFSLTFVETASLEVADSLCEGDLELYGSFTDSLNGDRPITVRTVPFEPECP